MTNSADPDQLASEKANWSGSTVYKGRAYLGKYDSDIFQFYKAWF